MKEIKVFGAAKTDSDSAVEYISPNDVLEAINVRVHSAGDGTDGYVTAIEGNRLLSRPLPAGTNKCIGAKHLSQTGKSYIFIYNSNNRHRIDEFDPSTQSFRTIYEQITNSSGANILQWTPGTYIKDIVVVQKQLLYFVEFPSDTARRIYIDGTYTTFTADHFHLSVRPPMYAPHVYFDSDGAYDYNNIRGRLFQFRSRYYYSHGEYSAWSPVSSRVVPEGEPTTLANSRAFNTIMVGVPYNETNIIERVEVSARFNDSEWFSIKTATRSHIQSLPVLPAPPEPQDPSNPPVLANTEFRTADADAYYFAFYNDGLYPADDVLEHNNIADMVPENTRALEAVNDNTILLGNNRIGKPRPQVDSFEVDVLYGSPPAPPDSFRLEWTTGYNLATERAFVNITFRGDPQEGDQILSSWYTAGGSGFPPDINYTVPAPQADDIGAVVHSFADQFTDPAIVDKVVVVSPTLPLAIYRFEIATGVLPSPKSISIQPATVLNENESIPAVKQGSSYEFMLAYYDRYGRPFPLVKGPTIKTPTFAVSKGAPLSFQWTLDGTPPPGAAYYQILASTNRTHSFSAYTLAYADNTLSDTTYLWLDIGMLFQFNEDVGSGNLAWDFVPGDRVALVRQSHTATPESYAWFNSPSLDLEILEYEIDTTDPDNPRHLIRLPNPSGVTIVKGAEYPINIEIYRRKDTLSPEQQVYYEVTPTYHVSGGQHQTETGFIEAIDSYYKLRRIPYTFGTSGIGFIDMWVEGLHFSDIYKSDYHNLGRARTYDDTPEGTVFKTEIRYSREWISGSRINGIVRFYPEDVYDAREPFYGASESYGGIQYLTNRENTVICVQETKIGYIPVNRSIIEDVEEQQQIGISSRLLNPIRYSVGANYGIGDSIAIPSYVFMGSAAYFIDPRNLAPVRAGLDGTREMYFNNKTKLMAAIRAAVSAGQYITSWADSDKQEIAFSIGNTVTVLNENTNGWLPSSITYKAEAGFSADKFLYTLNQGQLWIHDAKNTPATFYGVPGNISVTFPVSSPGVKNYQRLSVYSDKLLVTPTDGIKTQLGQVSDLLEVDFEDADGLLLAGEGVWYASFRRANPDPIEGDLLKGGYIIITLQPASTQDRTFKLLKVGIDSHLSTPSE